MWNDDLKDHGRAGQNLAGGTALAEHVAGTDGGEALAPRKVTVFRCVNCTRPATEPASTAGRRLSRLETQWGMPVHEVALPCAGRLQPEHVLKAFEAGADVVCIVTCAGEKCHYLEGSQRAERRIGYVKRLLDEIGLGGERLMVFQMSPTGQEHAALGQDPNGRSRGTQANGEEDGSRLAEIGEMVVAGLGALPPSPLRQNGATV